MKSTIIYLFIIVLISCNNDDIDQFKATHEVLNITCTSDGEIDLTVTGGTPPYQFLWSSGQVTEDLRGLKQAGSFYVLIVDGSGKSVIIDNIIVEETPSVILIEGTLINSDILLSNGFINLNVSGGRAPYSFAWSNKKTSKDIAELGSGFYTVEVTDINGCLTNAEFSIESVGEYVDNRDDRVYKTVQIGNQIWMYDPLSFNTAEGSSFVFDNPDDAEKGRLYTWETIMDGNNDQGRVRGLCPEGWHIPSLDEYVELESFILSEKDYLGFDFERYIAPPAGVEYRFISYISGVSWYQGGYTTYLTTDSTTFIGSYWDRFGNKGELFDVWDNTKEPYNTYPWTAHWKEFKHFCHCVKDN